MIAKYGRRLVSAALLGTVVAVFGVTVAATRMGESTFGGSGDLSAILIDREADGWERLDTQVFRSDADHTFEAILGTSTPVVIIMAWTRTVPPEVEYQVTIGPPYGEQLAVGTYEAALNGTGSGPPTLAMSHQPAETVGRFTVHQIETSGTEVIRFAATFEQHGRYWLGATFGEVRYHSTVPLPALILSPTSAAFASSGETRRFSVSNRGTTSQAVDVALHGPYPDDYRVAATDCVELQPGTSCTVDVVFETGAAGSRSATLVVNDETARASRTASLVGNGLAETTVDLTAEAAGSAVTLTASVGSTDGLVEFLDEDGAAIAVADIGADGTAIVEVSLPAGSHWIIASAVGPSFGRTESVATLVIVEP